MADASLAEIESRLARVEAELIRWTEDEFRDLRSCLMNLLVYVTDVEAMFPASTGTRDAGLYPVKYSVVYPANSVVLADADDLDVLFDYSVDAFQRAYTAFAEPLFTATVGRDFRTTPWREGFQVTEAHLPEISYCYVSDVQPDYEFEVTPVKSVEWTPTTNDPYPAFGMPLELVSGPNADIARAFGVYDDMPPYQVTFPWRMNTFENCCNPNAPRPSISQCNYPAMRNQLPFWTGDQPGGYTYGVGGQVMNTYAYAPALNFSLYDPSAGAPPVTNEFARRNIVSWHPLGDVAPATLVSATVRYPEDVEPWERRRTQVRGRVM